MTFLFAQFKKKQYLCTVLDFQTLKEEHILFQGIFLCKQVGKTIRAKEICPNTLVWACGACSLFADTVYCSTRPCIFLLKIMTANINNFGVINFYENNATKQEPNQKAEPVCEDISPVKEEESDYIDSIIFTKKAKKEGKIDLIIDALRKSMQGRRDKSRALAQEVQIWQDEKYIDAHYNAQVMYDELVKIMPLPFGYEAFKQHYNRTRS